jgi:hypothetical protein
MWLFRHKRLRIMTLPSKRLVGCSIAIAFVTIVLLRTLNINDQAPAPIKAFAETPLREVVAYEPPPKPRESTPSICPAEVRPSTPLSEDKQPVKIAAPKPTVEMVEAKPSTRPSDGKEPVKIAEAKPAVETAEAKLAIEVARVKELIEDFADQNPRVQSLASQSLVSLGHSAVPKLIEALSHKEAQVRWWATTTLGELGEPTAEALAAFVIRIQNEEDKAVKCAIAKSSAQLGFVKVVPHLIAMLDQPDESIRAAAAYSLGRMPHAEGSAPEIDAALSELLIDEDQAVQTVARECIFERQKHMVASAPGSAAGNLHR